ncbi:hypothetical protein A2Y99_00405 [Candidatus Gottesmanbacteria bacterium RBG_13_37_7]|uniref:Glycosyltransferase 2-like domain-containing protein n=1 Tax=Candidatus Gottesmanbacteria bacterium RBG_13_37_7 TaxID=1798369 RepID=A0A1F5YIV1_9BACT|nr:MAG: hypothetical protein A2Y99_00405 [Candidatus Gottesmanbacteria bacterium RBG_13_37_7]
MKLAILILHYGNFRLTRRCLDSIGKLKFDKKKAVTFLINNTPEKKLPSLKKEIRIVTNNTNLGFAKGMNVGIKLILKDAAVTHILLLNNDTVLPSDLLNIISETAADIFAPVIKFKSVNNSWRYDGGGKVNFWTGRTTHLETDSLPDPRQFDTSNIDFVSGCCMFIKRKVFEKIGFLDEDYFFYFEDVDFCLKARKAGFRLSVNPNYCLFHELGGTSGRWNNEAIRRNISGNAIFIRKNLGLRQPVAYFYLFLLTIKIVINRLFGK